LRRLAVAILFAAATAHARDPQRGAELFKEGREALASGDYALACRKFAESASADPRVGTFINLAQCEEKLGRLAASRQFWQQAVDLARGLGDERGGYAGEEFARIDARVPRLTVRLEASAPPDTVVRRDGVELTRSSLGIALPAELGAHKILVRAVGREPRDYDVDLREGERREIDVDVGPLVEPGAEPEPAPPPPPPPAPRAPGVLRPAAYVVGGIGAASLATGVVFAVLAKSAQSDATPHCDGDVCDAAGRTARLDEITRANVATIALVSGATLLAGGVALRVASPSPGEEPYVRRNLGFVALGAGAVALGAGAVLGLHALSAKGDADAGCNGDVCDHKGAAARREEIAAGNASTIAFVVGGALAATGAVLWLTSPRVTVAPGAVAGTF
jgi:hypothetical protein